MTARKYQVKEQGPVGDETGLALGEAGAAIARFRRSSRFLSAGAVITDLDGTAVHESDGKVIVAAAVVEGLKAVAEHERRVVLNTLRFPLNVVRTFGHVWGSITPHPVPLVSLNGAAVGVLVPTKAGETTFEPLAAFTLAPAEIDEVVAAVAEMLTYGLSNVMVFYYSTDWRRGETIWTPDPDRIGEIKERYVSAEHVVSMPLGKLHERLAAEEICMISILGDAAQDRRMAYQHANPHRFFTAAGVDKLSGAREAAARFGFELDQSVGAGDTPMDRFLSGVGLAFHVGPLALSYRGRLETVRLRSPLEFGRALFTLSKLPAPTDARH